MANSLDQVGVIAKTVQDTFTMLNYISGYDPKDARCIDNHKKNNVQRSDNTNLSGVKIAVFEEFFGE